MLNLLHERNGEAIPYRWGVWHLCRFLETVEAEGSNLVQTGHHVYLQDHTCVDETDGEIMTILAGDTIHMYR